MRGFLKTSHLKVRAGHSQLTWKEEYKPLNIKCFRNVLRSPYTEHEHCENYDTENHTVHPH